MLEIKGREILKKNYRLDLGGDYRGVVAHVEVYRDEFGCYMANFFFNYEGEKIKGRTIAMNGPGESKLVDRLKKETLALITSKEKNKRKF